MAAHCCDGADPHTHRHGDDAARRLTEGVPLPTGDFTTRSIAAYALLAQGRYDEALARYAALRADATDASLQDLLGLALCEALALDALGRHDEAMGRRAEVITRIEGADDALAAHLRALGEVALYDIALRLLREAKGRLRDGAVDEAGRGLVALQRRLAAHPALAAAALLRLLGAYAAFLLEERAGAVALLEAALAQDEVPVRQTARTLLALSPLPADAEFAALLDPPPPLVRIGP